MDRIKNNQNIIWNQIKYGLRKHYGLFIVGGYILAVILFGIIVQDNIYVALTDNMDSNIPIYKMIRDNELFWKFEESIPFLGGEVLRADYRVELSVQSWIYALFPTLLAYYIVYLIKVLGSSIGFYLLAKKIKKYDGINLKENIWCVCGLLYGILGTWPHAAIGFASLPWWCLNVYMIYKTKKKRYIFSSLLFVFTTSFTMLALFALFYTAVFIVVVTIKKRKIILALIFDFIVLSGAYIIANSHHVLQGIGGSKETIKSLKASSYTETILQSLFKFKQAFFFENSYYHTGGSILRYIIIPICTVFLFVFIFSLIRKRNLNRKIAILYIVIYGCIIVNTLACCFDNNKFFREIIPFASGFGFSRFAWLSPFLWIILMALVCEFLTNKVIIGSFIILGFASVIFDPLYTQLNSMYNDLYCNVSALFGNDQFKDGNHEWTWKEYYSEELFDKIKNDIGYDGSWSLAYGIEPSVLQYNGIKTLDGYYSNYSLEYHDQFQKLISPELEQDESHKSYWESSVGVRAYLWSKDWDFLAPKDFELKESDLYIDMDVFREMNGKYIFSRVKIKNSNDLGLSLIQSTHTHKESPYEVYVYCLEDM